MPASADTVERIRLDVRDVVSSASTGASSVDKLAASFAKLKSIQLGDVANDLGSIDAHVRRIHASETAVTADLQKQLALEAKIATFNVSRVRQTAALEHQLKQMTADAVAQPAAYDGSGWAKVGTTLIAGGVAIAAATAATAAMLAKASFDLTEAGTKFAIQETSRREKTLNAFKNITGSSKAASAEYEKMLNLAKNLGRSPEEVGAQMRKLLSDGFKAADVSKIIAAGADVAAVRGEAAATKFQRLLETTENKGKLDKAAIGQVAKMGISTADVYTELEKRLGKTRAQVDELLAGGKKSKGSIDAATGVAAIAAAAEKRFGGAAMREAMGSIDGLWNRLKIGFAELFTGMDLTPIKNALRSLITVLEGPAGEKLKGAFSKLFSAVSHALGDAFSGKAGQQRLTQFVLAFVQIVTAAAKVITAVTPIIVKFVNFLANDLGKLSTGKASWLDGLKDVGAAFAGLARGDALSAGVNFGKVIITISQALGLLSADKAAGLKSALDTLGKANSLIETGKTLGKAFSPSSNPAANTNAVQPVADAMVAAVDPSQIAAPDTGPIGTNMAQGVASGIDSGKAGIVSSMVSACDAAVAAAKSKLQIASPSQVFDGIGGNVAAGMAGGISRGSGAVASAARGMAGGAVGAMAGVGAPQNDNSRGGAGVAPSSGITGSGAGGGSAQHTYNLAIHQTSAPQMPPGATPEQAKALTAASNAQTAQDTEKQVLTLFRRLRETG